MTLRVATIVDYLVAGGAERTAVDVSMHLGDDVRSVLVSSRLTPQALGGERYAATVAELESAGVRILAPGRTHTAAAWQWRPVIEMLRRERVDVLHTHSWGSNFWGPLLARLGGVRVWVAHDQSPFAGRRGDDVPRREKVVNRHITGRLADALVVPSGWAREQLVRYERVPERRVRVIPNGASPPVPGANRAAVRKELGIAGDDDVIAIVAMLRPEKAHDVAIDALAAVSARRPRARLLIVGSGPRGAPAGTRPALEERAERLGVADRVLFTGHRHDTFDLVRAADAALLASARENLPLALLEYMESGTPLVATDVGGVAELVRHGVEGLLVPPGDARAMAAAIIETLEDPAASARRAAAARSRRQVEFNWRAIGRRTRDLYDELLAER